MDPDAGKVFVYGISRFTMDEMLQAHFSGYGELLKFGVLVDEHDKFSYYGVVEFANPSVVDRVVQDKHVIDDRWVVVRRPMSREEQEVAKNGPTGANSRGGGKGTKNIIIQGLPSYLTEVEFRHYFEYYGNVTKAEILCDQQRNEPRGFGVISFDSEAAVDRVLHKKYHHLGGKQVEVTRLYAMLTGWT